MTTNKKLGVVAALGAVLATLAFAAPASAFEGRGGRVRGEHAFREGRGGAVFREGRGYGRWYRPVFHHERRIGWR
jgi:hypothetical protein